MVTGNSNTSTPPPQPPPTVKLDPSSNTTVSLEEATVRAVNKRYEGLVMVRTKALRGKGAWYWAHLEPLLLHDDTGQPKAVKLKCCLCDTVFSASNPSRTATEHLKRGTCPNFTTTAAATANTTSSPTLPANSSPSPRPISSVSPGLPNSSSAALVLHHSSSATAVAVDHPQPSNHRKRRSSGGGGGVSYHQQSYHHVSPITTIEPPRYTHEFSSPTPSPIAASTQQPAATYPHHNQPHQQQQPHHHHQPQLILSGGKEDWGALAMLKDSVKRLKSPKTSPGPPLSKSQIDSAIDCFADWVYESCGSIPFTNLEHPKLKAFLTQVGLPLISKREFAGPRLDTKYEEVKSETEEKIRDAMFFQISSDGWRKRSEESFVSLTVNLPNGTSVFKGAVFNTGGEMPSKYAEEVLWETITDICSSGSGGGGGGSSTTNDGNNNGGCSSTSTSNIHQCVGIISDKYKNKALRNLENQHSWMVNLSCQYHGILSLFKDLYREFPLFHNVAENCGKLVNFVNNKTQVRNSFRKHRLREYGNSSLLLTSSSSSSIPLNNNNNYISAASDFDSVFLMIEDVIGSIRALQSILLDESYKLVLMEEPFAVEFAGMIRDSGFWNDLEAVRTLVKMIKKMAKEIETERPLISQCLPLWEELRLKVRNWTARFDCSSRGDDGILEKILERRFKKNYHPAWAAAYILDPLYLIRDGSGKYLPPFKYLTPQQEKDVDKLITRLVSREEAHVVLMELMKWRTEGLDPDYAQAVQLKQRDPITGKMRIAIPQSSRLVWETYLTEFKSLGKVAVRLIFLHATARGVRMNSRLVRSGVGGFSRSGIERVKKMMFVAANLKLERRDLISDEDKDAEFFASTSSLPSGNGDGEDDHGLNEVFVDTSSM